MFPIDFERMGFRGNELGGESPHARIQAACLMQRGLPCFATRGNVWSEADEAGATTDLDSLRFPYRGEDEPDYRVVGLHVLMAPRGRDLYYLEAELCKLPSTWQTIRPGGGSDYYFAAKDEPLGPTIPHVTLMGTRARFLQSAAVVGSTNGATTNGGPRLKYIWAPGKSFCQVALAPLPAIWMTTFGTISANVVKRHEFDGNVGGARGL
jgi:hypothetical protein